MAQNTKTVFCCGSPSIPRSSPSNALTIFLEAIEKLSMSKQLQREFLFPPYYALPDTHSPPPMSKKVIEIEAIRNRNAPQNEPRGIKHYVYLEGEGNNNTKGASLGGKTLLELQMYPEEAFREVKEQVVDQWFAARSEWWDKDVKKEDEHVGWICKNCKVEYHARVLTVAD